MSEYNQERLDRIEQVVTDLEVDIKLMAKAVGEMAASMKQLVEMQTEQKLLKQEMDNRCSIVTQEIKDSKEDRSKIWSTVRAHDKRMSGIDKVVLKNEWSSGVAGKVAWAVVSAVITGVVGAVLIILNMK